MLELHRKREVIQTHSTINRNIDVNPRTTVKRDKDAKFIYELAQNR